MNLEESIVTPQDLVLVTGSSGFLGVKIVEKLLHNGFRDLRCLVRSQSRIPQLQSVLSNFDSVNAEIMKGNLNDPEYCRRAVEDAALVINCAAGMSGGLVSMYVDSVVSARNLLSVLRDDGKLRRIVHVSSFSVYETANLKRGELLTEETPVESHHTERNDAYSYTKVKQEQLFWKFATEHAIPLVVIRPGVIFGPGGAELSPRVGFMFNHVVFHLGDSNIIPLTYVDNCAEAIVLAATKPGIENEIFNIVDDELPTSSEFLRMYKAAKENVRSVTVPYFVTQLFSRILKWYARHSSEQIPAFLTPHRVASVWKHVSFDNAKSKRLLGWSPVVPTSDALNLHFQYVRSKS
jgi:nucleoside-diphosphate-sugar epimerase